MIILKNKKRIALLCLILTVCLWGTAAAASEDKGAESIVGWMIERIADKEVDITDEDSIREAIEEGEQELSITLTEKEEERIIGFVTTLDAIEVEAGDFMDQAKILYQKYSTELVEQTNDAINEAVDSAVKGAVSNFFESLKQAVADFFTNLLSA